MPHQVVVGAGMIGRPLAERLAERGDRVGIATRSGAAVHGATSLVLNAADPAAFGRAAAGAATIFLCTNPRYTDWPAQWPPVIDAAISAASATVARLVVMGNHYPYGSPNAPMTEQPPEATTETKGLVRKEGWRRMRAAHDRGVIRAVEVRASDYFGPGVAGTAHLGDRFFTAIGRYGTHGKVAGYPQWLLRSLGKVNPMMHEIWASSYQFLVPYVIDSAETERELRVAATQWADALLTTAESYRHTA
jgi:nucleoside-diphosphate-sugar epimerase